MVLFNYSTKELTAKVVYYGPGLCGKTTNLQWIHEKLPIKNKGKMLSLATETDRTLFFDFLPIEIGTIRGMKTRIQLYTVPGQVFYNATRRMVLKGADAVCFVCDSQEAMLDANLESYENMRQNLEANEIDPDEIPVVLQYNKRDLPNALPIEILNERINPHNYPFYEAIAVKGVGVEDTLKAVTKLVFKSLSAKYGEGSAAPSPPGRAPGPPRAARPASPFTPEPVGFAADDPLGELDLSMSEPDPPSPSLDLPAIEFEEDTPVGSVFPQPAQTPVPAPRATPPPQTPRPTPPPQASRPPTPPSRPPVPASRPPVPPSRPPLPPQRTLEPIPPARETPRPPLSAHRPQSTLVSKQDEAAELRRRIAAPGLSEEVEMDLEEIEDFDHSTDAEDFDHPTHASFVPAEAAETAAPEPLMRPEPMGATEVEVPIDIEVAPGTTRISLNIKLQLNLRRR
jgi:signal recognition particle receptor subunit beta